MGKRKRRHFGSTDFFGLDAFGAAEGKAGLIGIMLGGGVGTATALGLKSMEPGSMMNKNSDLFGLLAGAGAATAYGLATKKHEAMWAGIAAALFTQGVRVVEKMFSPVSGIGEIGLYTMPPVPAVPTADRIVGGGIAGLGIHSIADGYGVPAPGAAPITDVRQLSGPSLGATKKPTLVGLDQAHGLAAAKAKVSLLGGPNIDGLASAYGATMFGGGAR